MWMIIIVTASVSLIIGFMVCAWLASGKICDMQQQIDNKCYRCKLYGGTTELRK